MITRNRIRSLSLCIGLLILALGRGIAASPVVMKVLVMTGSTTETSYQAITTILSQIGVPYQTMVLSDVSPDSSGNRLSSAIFSNSATGQGSYQGIILTDNTFAACSSGCLSSTDWATLNAYASQFSVRIASYFTAPAAQWGLLPVDSGPSYSISNPLRVTLTAEGMAVFPYLNAANAIPVAGQGTTGVRAYQAMPTAAPNESTTSLMTVGPYTVAATHTTSDGRELLALTMDNAPALLHSQAFGYGVINWVTKGIFLGSRKLYLNPETDDFLLGNWLYAPSQHPSCEGSYTCPTYYMTGADLQAHANWQTNVQADPQFASYRGTFAFNGIGTTWFSSSDPVFAAIKSLNNNFWWLSHTWDHPNLDCYSISNNGACVAASLSQSSTELNQNISITSSLGITLDRLGMVTPFNSGLSNANFLNAAAQAGVRYIVIPQYPATPNSVIPSTLSPSVLQVTRMNNDLFDDASTPYAGVPGSWPDEYNSLYGPGGLKPVYSQNQSYSQILENLSQDFLQTNLLTYAPYPLAFHIANLASYDGVHSPFTDVMDATIRKYKSLMNLPVLSIPLEDVGALLTARTSYDSSGVVGVFTPGVNVVLTTTRAATIPITGACSQAECGTYGGQIQDNIVMNPGASVTLSLSSNNGVTLSSLSISPTSLTAGSTAAGKVTLSGPASAGGVSVVLSSNNASVAVPPSVTVPAGSATATFSVTANSVSATTSAIVTAIYATTSEAATLTINPAPDVTLSSISLNPASVSAGASVTGTVTISAPAPTGGVLVSLASNNSAATTPASVSVPAGSTIASFTISTQSSAGTTSVTISASYNGGNKTATLAISQAAAVSLASITVNPSTVNSFTTANGTVTLNNPAPPGGTVVSLSNSSDAAVVPATVTVPAGSSTATFSVTTKSVAYTTPVTFAGVYNGETKTTVLTIQPFADVALASVSITPSSITTGSTATGTVTLDAAAPTGGISIELWTTGAVAFVPEEVTIAAGSTTASFSITTNYTGTTKQDVVTAFYNGMSKMASVTVTP